MYKLIINGEKVASYSSRNQAWKAFYRARDAHQSARLLDRRGRIAASCRAGKEIY